VQSTYGTVPVIGLELGLRHRSIIVGMIQAADPAADKGLRSMSQEAAGSLRGKPGHSGVVDDANEVW
jgi:hypothetical protein